MSYIYIAKQAIYPEPSEILNELVKYYENNVVKVADLLKLKKSDMPVDIALYFEEGEGAAYNRTERKIIYRFKKGINLLEDKGRLIHEASHVVQDYPFTLIPNTPAWCWAEGIADFCRLKLDPDFRLDMILSCEPENSYRNAAYFLEWLSNKHTAIVADINLLIRDRGLTLKRHDDIFYELMRRSLKDLKRECIFEKTTKL